MLSNEVILAIPNIGLIRNLKGYEHIYAPYYLRFHVRFPSSCSLRSFAAVTAVAVRPIAVVAAAVFGHYYCYLYYCSVAVVVAVGVFFVAL